ncbi:sensor histidine kinase [Duganella violaceipulchra]|uniref:Histidine kinase n=1 Tax=Duganella violaceipulchra TaxID=2849652 RepID=A0AA41HB40_9BURK|nr:histidine kinase [Duganella violaceicalia]MBV6321617.1 histidine kinase [Duganella violaceicalia]MCP2008123.1 signal transduction histidine kinase [Duganella violaceicalia]
MLHRFKNNLIGIIGLLGCVVGGALDIIHFHLGGIKADTPLGQLALWIASGFTPAPSAIRAGTDRDELTVLLFLIAYVALMVLFGLLFWLRTGGAAARRPAWQGQAMLAAQMAIALSYPHSLLYLVAAELGLVLGLRSGLRWLALQLLLLVLLVLAPLPGNDTTRSDGWVREVLLDLGTMALWQGIAFGIGHMAAVERRGRIELAAANGELRATQLLLADTVRSAERLRIARDLHDIVGHHLTALNLHLDLALRQSGAAAPPALATARALAQGLLAEVRVVVGSERGMQRIDLRVALAALCAGIPQPRIALRFAPGLEIASPAVAHTLFCCVQEAISNAVRHAAAGQLDIELARADDGLSVLLRIEDDGAGSRATEEGNGLRGMRERLALLGGELKAGNRPRRGFGMEIVLPAGAVAA